MTYSRSVLAYIIFYATTLFNSKGRNPFRLGFLLAFYVIPAFSAEYETRGNTEMVYLGSKNVDLDVQFSLIRAATSIDFVGYSQTIDLYGEPFMQAVHAAQKNNGAKVRFVYDRSLSMDKNDLFNQVKAIISDPSLPCRGEALCAHPIEKLSSGIGFLDYVHHKITILNLGKPDEVVLMGFGRGKTANSAGWIDSSVAFRRINPNLPYVGDDIQAMFDSVYKALGKLADQSWIRIPRQVKRGSTLLPESSPKTFSITSIEKQHTAELLALLRTPAILTPASELKPFQFQPKGVKAMSNDLFQQLVDHRGKNRDTYVNDNQRIMNAEIREFNGTIDWTSYSYGPTDGTHQALVDFVNRGNTLNLYLNGPVAFKVAMDSEFAMPYTYESVGRLIKEIKPESGGKVNLYVLNPQRNPEMLEAPYIHRRMVVFSNEKTKFVYAGSDPLTWSAAHKNDENLFLIEDVRFGKYMMDVTSSELSHFDLLTHEETLHFDANRPWKYLCLRSLVRKFF
ncbi:MAG: hypothetical protein H7301_07825 [Cryobacterium sp.]|nr:hypothetical protein [Oligoflexia bacterium]